MDPASPPPRGWLTLAGGAAYPPAPWRLGGSLLVSVFRVPVRAIPDEARVERPRSMPWRQPRHCLLLVAFAHYAPGSVLAYDELLVAVLGRTVSSWSVTVPQIWVDSDSARAGGHELWGLPKKLGEFSRRTAPPNETRTVGAEGGTVAEVAARIGCPLLPGWHRTRFTTAQHRDGATVTANHLLLFRPRRLHATWTFSAAGPLGYLSGQPQVASLAATDASLTFGLSAQHESRP